MALLEARNLTKTYTVDDRVITVLDNVSLSAEKGEFIVIAGSSGSGKTTLLTLLSGLDHPTSGQVLLDDRDITDATEEQLAPMLGAYCPSVLFPYAREVVSDLVTRGSFPQFVLQPVNFEAIYTQQRQAKAEQAESGGRTRENQCE